MEDQDLNVAKEKFNTIAEHCYNCGVETLANTARIFTIECENAESTDKVIDYIEELREIAGEMDIMEYKEIEIAYEELLSEIG